MEILAAALLSVAIMLALATAALVYAVLELGRALAPRALTPLEPAVGTLWDEFECDNCEEEYDLEDRWYWHPPLSGDPSERLSLCEACHRQALKDWGVPVTADGADFDASDEEQEEEPAFVAEVAEPEPTEAPEPPPAPSRRQLAQRAAEAKQPASKGPEYVCGGDRKRHRYADSKLAGHCGNCGAPAPAVGQMAAVTTPEQAAAWREHGTVPSVELLPAPSKAPKSDAEPEPDPAGAHVAGPATSKATSTGPTRAARRGGAAVPLTVMGEVAEEPQDAPLVVPVASPDHCPRGHGRLNLTATDEYGDPDPHCTVCGHRPPPPNAEELMREASGPREGAQRRREPSIRGMRI